MAIESQITSNYRVSGVSVIVPAYNGAQWIANSLRSVLNQSADVSIEVIVVDDCSTDMTCSVVESLNDPRIRIVKTQKNIGVAGARNLGITNARYDWIAFNDQDDAWTPKKLKLQIKFLDDHPGVSAVASGSGRLSRDGLSQWAGSFLWFRWAPVHLHQLNNSPYYDPRTDGTTYLQTYLIMKRELLRIGGFQENLPLSDDLDVQMRLAEVAKMGYVPEPLFLYYLGNHNQTAPGQLKAKRFLAAHHFCFAAAEARAKGLSEPNIEELFCNFEPTDREIKLFRVRQAFRNVNTIWVNKGLSLALAYLVFLLIRNPVLAIQYIFRKYR